MWEYNFTNSENNFLAHSGSKGMKWGYNKGKSNGGRTAAKVERPDFSKMTNTEREKYCLTEGYDSLSDDWKYEFRKMAESELVKGSDGYYTDKFGRKNKDKNSLLDAGARFKYLEAQNNSKKQGLPFQEFKEGGASTYKRDKKNKMFETKPKSKKGQLNTGSYQKISK